MPRRRKVLLTPRETEVIRRFDRGDNAREAAERLRCSVGTVRKHLEHIFRKYGVKNRNAAAYLFRLDNRRKGKDADGA